MELFRALISFSDLLVGVVGTHPLVWLILNDFNCFDRGFEVSKERVVVQLCFHTLRFNEITFLQCRSQ